MLLQHARRDARVVDGRLVLLPRAGPDPLAPHEALEALDLLRPLVDAPPGTRMFETIC